MKKIIIIACITVCVVILTITYFAIKPVDDTETSAINKSLIGKKITDVSGFKQKITKSAMSHLPDLSQMSGHGIRLFNENGKFISENNIIISEDSYKCFVSLANAYKNKDRMSFMIFLDDKLLEYHVDNWEKSQTYYTYQLPAYSMVNIPIEFSLKNIRKDVRHRLWFVYFYGMDKIPKIGNEIPYFTASMEKEVILSNGSDNLKPFTPSINTINADKKFISGSGYKTVVTTSGKKDAIYQSPILTLRKGENVKFNMKAYDKGKHNYSTIVFFDNKPVMFSNGSENILWKSSIDKILNFDFSIKMPEKTGNYPLYAVWIPFEKYLDHDFMTSERINISVVD